MLRLARQFGPDVLVARTGISAGAVGRLLRVPSVIFDDTEFAWLQRRLSVPLATVVCTGMGYGARFPGKQLTFNAPPHLMYTHPSRFHPDRDRLGRHGLDPEEPYFVLRVKAWRALHDSGVRGPSDEDLTLLVESLVQHGRPVISSERSLPAALRQYVNPLPVKDMLHLLAFARLCVGEGSCTVAEAACLGTPAVFLSPRSRRGYLDALERDYGLARTVRTPGEALECARRWLEDPGLQRRAAAARERLLRDCADPLAFALHVITRYGREGEEREWPS
jgi:predicted glycosyltransferase